MRTRKCIQTGQVLPEARLVRFAIGPDDTVVPDVKARAPGRGLWLCADRAVLASAIKKNSFSRAAKAKLLVSKDLATQTETALRRAALDILGLAKRSGELLCGFEQVHALLQKQRPACLVEAADGAADGRGKVLALARGKWGEIPVIGCFTKTEMGAPIGRATSTHMALLGGGLAERFIFHGERLCAFRLLFSDEWGDMRS